MVTFICLEPMIFADEARGRQSKVKVVPLRYAFDIDLDVRATVVMRYWLKKRDRT